MYLCKLNGNIFPIFIFAKTRELLYNSKTVKNHLNWMNTLNYGECQDAPVILWMLKIY